jgi:hypothetical protein
MVLVEGLHCQTVVHTITGPWRYPLTDYSPRADAAKRT